MTVPNTKSVGDPGHTSDHNLIRGELVEAETHQNTAGIHVPAGGTTGQALTKVSGTSGDTAWTTVSGGGGGVTDHGALTGLADDDHTNYLNNTRGDARYPLKSNNLSDLASAATARTNLGLGDSAVKNTGSAAGTVSAGDHTHAASGGSGHAIHASTFVGITSLPEQPNLLFAGLGVSGKDEPNRLTDGSTTIVIGGPAAEPQMLGDAVGNSLEPIGRPNGTLAIAAGEMYAVPIVVSWSAMSIDQIGFEVTGTSAGTVEVGLYNSNSTLVQTRQSYVTGIAVNTTGFKAVTLPAAYSFSSQTNASSALFWLVLLSLGGTVTVRAYDHMNGMQAHPYGYFGDFDNFGINKRTGLATSLPTTFGSTNRTLVATGPRMAARRSA